MNVDKKSLSKDLVDLVGEENVIFEDKKLKKFGTDRFGKEHTPLIVVKPSSPSHFKRLNFILRRYQIDSLTPRGYGLSTNLSAFSEDLVIDLTYLNKEIEIDIQNLLVNTQAGNSFLNVQNKLIKEGYRLPIEPILNGTIGGFIASGGYGYGTYRYGSLMNILHDISIFITNGQIIQTGTPNLPPYSCGYNLNSLICGSEGYFGIITEAVLEIIPIAQHSYNLLFSPKNNSDLVQIITKITNLTSLNNISLYKGLSGVSSDTLNVLIRLEGSEHTIKKDQSLIENIHNVNHCDSNKANKLWETRIKNSSQIPESSMILEVIIPLKHFSQFVSFLDSLNSPPYFGIFLNSGTILLSIFLAKSLTDSRKNEILTKLMKRFNNFQAYPPTIDNILKNFVLNFHPNLNLLKKFKPIFDKTNRMKSRKLFF
ncbi:MAG TPA: FAD-binding oxidoreductase [Candidatus Deferrimicrobium sp.]|nr:FAD-binding oxidoreductase [Candidatus Deferrimicrobium sp.]